MLEKAAGMKHKGGKGAAASATATATAAAKKHLAAKKPFGADDGDEPFEKRFSKLTREEQLRKVERFFRTVFTLTLSPISLHTCSACAHLPSSPSG